MQTFNEFFIRELKNGARPIACVGHDDVAVSAADSRLMAFRTAEESLRFWIKVCIFNHLFTIWYHGNYIFVDLFWLIYLPS